MNADELVEEYGAALKAKALAVADLAQAEDAMKIVLSEQVMANRNAQNPRPITEAEHAARASAHYKQASDDAYKARVLAETAAGRVEYLKVRFEKWRTSMSFKKAQMGQG